MSRSGMRGVVLTLTALIGVAWNVTALAALVTCNKTSEPVTVAFAWTQTSGWAMDSVQSYGWWHIAPGDCQTWDAFDGTTFASGRETYLFYAHSAAGDWSGERQLCVHLGEPFTEARFRSTERECSNGVLRGFRPITLDAKSGTLNLLPSH